MDPTFSSNPTANTNDNWLKPPSIFQVIIIASCLLGLIFLIVSYSSSYKSILNLAFKLSIAYFYVTIVLFLVSVTSGYLAAMKYQFPKVLKGGLIISLVIGLLPPLIVLLHGLFLYLNSSSHGFEMLGAIIAFALMLFGSVVIALLAASIIFLGISIGVLAHKYLSKTQ